MSDTMIYKPEEQSSNISRMPWNGGNQNTAPAQQQPSPMQPQQQKARWQ